MTKTYTPYEQRVRKAFADAWGFFDAHKLARTYEDWEAIANAGNAITDPLAIDLYVAVTGELEREYKENSAKEKPTSPGTVVG